MIKFYVHCECQVNTNKNSVNNTCTHTNVIIKQKVLKVILSKIEMDLFDLKHGYDISTHLHYTMYM